MTRAMLDRVKTDASFGYRKPRFKLSDRPGPETIRSFDVLQLIRETMTDLSFSHPILKRNRRESQVKTPPNYFVDLEEYLSEEECEEITATENTSDNPPEEKITQKRSNSEQQINAKEVKAQAIVLPAIYNHQGRNLTKRDYGKTSDSKPLEIHEAANYRYVRRVTNLYYRNK